MKELKRSAAFIMMVLLLGACSQSREIRKMNKDVSAEWTVQTVSVEGGGGNDNIKVFDDEGFKCFIGSIWKFNGKNSGTGFYSVQSNRDCPAVKTNIHWAIHKTELVTKNISFTKLDAGLKTVDKNNIYNLEISMVSATNMQLKWNIAYENKPATVVFNLTKNK